MAALEEAQRSHHEKLEQALSEERERSKAAIEEVLNEERKKTTELFEELKVSSLECHTTHTLTPSTFMYVHCHMSHTLTTACYNSNRVTCLTPSLHHHSCTSSLASHPHNTIPHTLTGIPRDSHGGWAS